MSSSPSAADANNNSDHQIQGDEASSPLPPPVSSTSQFELMLQKALQENPEAAFGEDAPASTAAVVGSGSNNNGQESSSPSTEPQQQENTPMTDEDDSKNPSAVPLSSSETTSHDNMDTSVTQDEEEGEKSFPSLHSLNEKLRSKKFPERRVALNDLKKWMDEREKEVQLSDDSISLLLNEKNVLLQELSVPITLKYLNRNLSQVSVLTFNLKNIIQKLLVSKKDSTRDAAAQLLLLAMQHNLMEQTVELLIPATKHKMPKLRLASIRTLREGFEQSGPKMPLKHFLKHLSQWFADSEEDVRKEATELACALYRALGAKNLQPYIKDLRSTQMDILKNRFEKIDQDQTSAPSSATTPAAASTKKVVPAKQAASNITSNPSASQFSLPSTEILSKIPKNLDDDLASPKWLVRQGALEKVLKLVEQPNLDKSGDYAPLIGKIIKVISKDKHVQVVKTAVCILGHLAHSLGSSVAHHVKPVISVLLSKFKERGPGVTDAIHASLDLIERNCVPLSDCRSDIVTACKSKVPQVKYNTLYWIERSIEHTQGRLLSIAPTLAQSFTPLTKDANQQVRDGSCKALGRLMWRVGEQHIIQYLEKLEKIPKDKVIEYCTSLGENQNVYTENDEAAGIGMELEDTTTRKAKRPKTGVRRPKSRSRSRPKERPKSAITAKSLTGRTQKTPKIKKASSSATSTKVAPSISKDQALSQAQDTLPDHIIAKLEDKKWKIRLEGAQETKDYIASLGASVSQQADVFIRFLEQKPGFNDSNINVLSVVFETLELIARNASPFKTSNAVAAIPNLVEKLAQAKVKNAAFSCLMAFCEFTNPQFVLSTSYPVILKQKNPKIISESLVWIQKTVENFGISLLNVPAMVDFCKSCLENTNPKVKEAATNVLVSLKSCGASNIEDMITDVKPILLNKITKRLAATESNDDFQPVIEVKGEVPQELVEGGGNNVEPTDISSYLSGPVKEMESPKWKTRLAAVESVQDILKQTQYCITPNIVPLVRALKQLLEDSNIRVVVESLKLIDSLARSMGTAGEKYNKIILQPLVAKLSNNSKPIRAAALHSLNEWCEHMSFVPMLKYVAKVISNPKSHPEGRKGCLELILKNFSKMEARPELVVMLTKHVIKCLTDKNPELRKISEHLLGLMIECVGQEKVLAQAQKLNLKPAIMRTLHPIIQKYEKKELPAEINHPLSSTAPALSGGSIARSASGAPPPETPARPNTASKRAGASKASSPRNPNVLFLQNHHKHLREAKDAGLHHWSFEPNLKKDMMLSVNHAMKTSVSPLLHRQMFSENFQAQVDAISTIAENVEIYGLEIRQSIDLIYRWISVLILDCNTTLLVKSLEFIHKSLMLFDSTDPMSDYEASCILPMLIEKVGHNITSVRQKIHALIREFVPVAVKPRRLVTFLVQGLKSKSYRSRADCLALISVLMKEHGAATVFSLQQHLPLVCISLDDCEVVKSAGVQLIDQVYAVYGASILDPSLHLKQKHSAFIQSKFNISSETIREAQQDMMQDEEQEVTKEKQTAPSPEPSSMAPDSEFDLKTPIETLIDAVGVFPYDDAKNERAIDALKVISEIMRHHRRSFVLKTKSVFQTLTQNITIAFRCASEKSVTHRLPKHVLNCVMNLFEIRDLATFVQKEDLQDIVEQLLSLLLDNTTIGSLEDGQELNRAMNTLIIRILENSNRTYVYTVLLNLLSQAASEPKPALVELIVKCLLKITKQLSKTIDRIDIDILLMDVDQFLNASDRYRSPTDLPLRSVKTILSELIKIKGESIRDHLTLIRASKNSPIEKYIRMILSSSQPAPSSEPSRKRQRIYGPEHVDDDGDANHTQLLESIFSKIRVESTCQEGLKELFRFQKENPSVSVQSWMEQCSDPFQEYIHRQLRKIELHDKEKQVSGESTEHSTDVYTSKFREIQKKYSVTATESSLPLFTRSRSTSNSSDTAASFESIREQWKRQKRKSISNSSSNLHSSSGNSLDFESLRKRFQSLPKRRSNSIHKTESPITLETLKKRMEKTSGKSAGSSLVTKGETNKENVPTPPPAEMR